MSAHTSTPARRRLWIAVAFTAALAAVIGGFVIVQPRLERAGIFLVPPTPTRYAELALERLDEGIVGTEKTRAEVRERVLAEAADAPDFASLHPVLAEAAKTLGGDHSSLLTGADAATVADTTRADAAGPVPTPTVTTQSGVTTIVVPALDSVSIADAEAYIAAARDGLEKARSQTTAGWIVDLRGNGGGNLWPMLGALAPLLADGHVLSFAYVDHADEVTVDGGTVRLRDAVQASAPTTFTTDLPVAVLIDGGTGSSGEAAAISFIGQPGTRLFGAPSYGFSTANQATSLYDGAVLNMTVAVDADRTGTRYGVPIEPDEQSGDPASAAAAWLMGR